MNEQDNADEKIPVMVVEVLDDGTEKVLLEELVWSQLKINDLLCMLKDYSKYYSSGDYVITTANGTDVSVEAPCAYYPKLCFYKWDNLRFKVLKQSPDGEVLVYDGYRLPGAHFIYQAYFDDVANSLAPSEWKALDSGALILRDDAGKIIGPHEPLGLPGTIHMMPRDVKKMGGKYTKVQIKEKLYPLGIRFRTRKRDDRMEKIVWVDTAPDQKSTIISDDTAIVEGRICHGDVILAYKGCEELVWATAYQWRNNCWFKLPLQSSGHSSLTFHEDELLWTFEGEGAKWRPWLTYKPIRNGFSTKLTPMDISYVNRFKRSGWIEHQYIRAIRSGKSGQEAVAESFFAPGEPGSELELFDLRLAWRWDHEQDYNHPIPGWHSGVVQDVKFSRADKAKNITIL